MNPEKVTVEFYQDALLTHMVGAAELPRKRMVESAQTIGKAMCRVLHLNLLEARLLDADGNQIDHMVVYR